MGVFGELGCTSVAKSSALKCVRFSVGSESDRCTLRNDRDNDSDVAKIWRNRGRSFGLNLIQSSISRNIAFGVSLRHFERSGRKYPRPTMNRIWSLLILLLFMLQYGNCWAKSSNMTMPNAYTSDWKVYGFESSMRITSGAIQSIEPVGWLNCCDPSQRVFTVASPKSPILTVKSSCKKISTKKKGKN